MKGIPATLLWTLVLLVGSYCVAKEAAECTVDAGTGQQVCKAPEGDVVSMLKNAFGLTAAATDEADQEGLEFVEDMFAQDQELKEKEKSKADVPPTSFERLEVNDTQPDSFLAKMSQLLLFQKDQSTQELLDSFLAAVTPDWNKYHAGIELLQLLSNATDRVKEQFDKYFGDIGLSKFNAVQLYYYMLDEEGRKNAVWKRRQHRFLPTVPLEEVMQLGDGMYLCQLAYSDSCEDIETYVKRFRNDTWVVRNCTVKALPFQPASYLLAPRESEQQPSEDDDDVLELALVIRATKEIGDILSDGLLEAADYRGGKTHQGMMESGRYLYNLYKDDLLNLLQTSNKTKIKLTILGHSLGGGAAQLTAAEFMENDEIDAYAVGYGAPSVFTAEYSESVKPLMTSVVVDADVVARLSGASAVNAWLKVLGYNFTEPALADVEQFFPLLRERLAPYGEWTLGALDSIRTKLEAQIRKDSDAQLQVRQSVSRPPHVQELFPAGECVHVFRDGATWQSVYMPCKQFDEIEVVKLMVDDHMTSTGYYPGLLGYARALTDDPNWNFEHDIMDLPVML